MADDNYQTQIDSLNAQVNVLNGEDEIKKLKKEVKHRTLIPITSNMNFLTRLKVRIENGLKRTEHLSLVNNATSVIFIISLLSTLLTFIFAKGAVIDAATLSLLTGALSESGSFISNKYGVSNSVPVGYIPPVDPKPIEIISSTEQTNSEQVTTTDEI
jgi:hypothetical protein